MSEQTAGVQALTLNTITEDNWQADLRDSIRSASALLNAVNLSADDLGEHERAALEFPIRVPLPFVARMIPGDPHDPLLRQIITDRAETLPAAGFTEDPLEEANANALKHYFKSCELRNLKALRYIQAHSRIICKALGHLRLCDLNVKKLEEYRDSGTVIWGSGPKAISAQQP